MLIESIVWIVITFLVRAQLDRAAAGWQLSPIWLFLLKIGVVLAMIAIAVTLHGMIFRWLIKKGILAEERAEGKGE